ncbi:MAG: hypothetical protein ACRCTL_01715 [Pseudomonas sp.]
MPALTHENDYLIETLARAATLKETTPGDKILQHITQILDRHEEPTSSHIEALERSNEIKQYNRELAERRMKEIGEILSRDDLRDVAIERISAIVTVANTPIDA